MSSLRLIAPAKLNLSLHIVGKRLDGYHLLESLVAFTAFGDLLELAPADALTFQTRGAFASALSPDDNLVMRVARMLTERYGVKNGAHITLHKNIPVGAGLGGGSADAAAAMVGLCRLWELPIKLDDIREMALSLGSDVPACLLSKTAWLTGIGETITPVQMPELWLVLVNPRLPLLTADVYHAFDGSFIAPGARPEQWENTESLVQFLRNQHNALQSPALSLMPPIGELLAALQATPECLLARMSGSGATCFGLYPDAQLAEQAALSLQADHPEWWVTATSVHAQESSHEAQ